MFAAQTVGLQFFWDGFMCLAGRRAAVCERCYVSVLGLTGLSTAGVSALWYLEQKTSDSYDYKTAFSLLCVCVCVCARRGLIQLHNK